MSAAQRPRATAADLAALPEGKRAEIIGGVLIEKANASFEHGDAQSSVVEAIKAPFHRGRGGPGGWWIATEVEIELETHEVYLPDVVGWRRERERPRVRPVPIRPDWICEVLSVSNAENDLGKKLFAYRRNGVPHYWIVDPEHETLIVYRWSSEGYLVALSAGRNEIVRPEPFEAVELHVADLFSDR